MPSLIVISGKNEGEYYPFSSRTMVIGRDEACTIQLLDELISRKHLQIRFDANRNCHLAQDMKSANGVVINGRHIESETVLNDYDEIELGKTKLVFQVQADKDRESAFDRYHQRGERGKSTLVRFPSK